MGVAAVLAFGGVALLGPFGGLVQAGVGLARPGGGEAAASAPAGAATETRPPGDIGASGATPAADGPAGSAGTPAGSDPGRSTAPAELPACRFADAPAVPRPDGDWTLAILDTEVRLPSGYEPPDLVPVAQAGLSGGGEVRNVMIPDLRALTAAATQAGVPLQAKSAYRSEVRQKAVFDEWARESGDAAARQFSARPGHSEHELGTAVDFAAEDGSAPWDAAFEQTAQAHWLATHAAAYGFVMSYPKDAEAVTCYAYEPWHYRWVGRTVAKEVAASGLPLRVWLWSTRDGAG